MSKVEKDQVSGEHAFVVEPKTGLLTVKGGAVSISISKLVKTQAGKDALSGIAGIRKLKARKLEKAS